MEWIPVEERLPENHKDVLVLITYLEAEFDMENGRYDESKSYWTEPVPAIACVFANSCNCVMWNRMGKISHWFPIPELPK